MVINAIRLLKMSINESGSLFFTHDEKLPLVRATDHAVMHSADRLLSSELTDMHYAFSGNDRFPPICFRQG